MNETANNLMFLSLFSWCFWAFGGIPWAFIRLMWGTHTGEGKWKGFKHLLIWFVINVAFMVWYGYTYGNWS